MRSFGRALENGDVSVKNGQSKRQSFRTLAIHNDKDD